MDFGECDDTVDAVNAGEKGSVRGSAQPRKQVKFDPPLAPTPNAAERRAADDQGKKDIDDRRKAKKNDLVCYICGGKGHPARLCPSPSANAVNDEDVGEEDEEESESEGHCCGVVWADSLDNRNLPRRHCGERAAQTSAAISSRRDGSQQHLAGGTREAPAHERR